eukprot:256848-Pelagomonas_calceolata.AAC.2
MGAQNTESSPACPALQQRATAALQTTRTTHQSNVIFLPFHDRCSGFKLFVVFGLFPDHPMAIGLEE